MPVFDLITLDVFSALFDIRTSLLPQLIHMLPQEANAGFVLQGWRNQQLAYALASNSLSGEHISFQTITARSLAWALHNAGCNLAEPDRDSLVSAWGHLALWPEAKTVLLELQERGCRLALLSNGDLLTLQALARRLPVEVDAIFSCQEAGFYKPHPAVYRLPGMRYDLPAGRILHVAGSPTDVMGARSAGLMCYWSNRLGGRLVDPSLQPTFEGPNLLGLLEVI